MRLPGSIASSISKDTRLDDKICYSSMRKQRVVGLDNIVKVVKTSRYVFVGVGEVNLVAAPDELVKPVRAIGARNTVPTRNDKVLVDNCVPGFRVALC